MFTQKAFNNYDTNNNGYIELDELEILMKNNCKDLKIEPPTRQEV